MARRSSRSNNNDGDAGTTNADDTTHDDDALVVPNIAAIDDDDDDDADTNIDPPRDAIDAIDAIDDSDSGSALCHDASPPHEEDSKDASVTDARAHDDVHANDDGDDDDSNFHSHEAGAHDDDDDVTHNPAYHASTNDCPLADAIPHETHRAAQHEHEHDNNNNSNQDANDDNANDVDVDEDDNDDEEEEKWDLCNIFTIEQLNDTDKQQQCMTKKCPLLACSTYVSNLDQDYQWHTCMDCQEKDYEGWPESINEIPIAFMTAEHRRVIIEKCTGQYSPNMPNIPINEHGDFENALSVDAGAGTDTGTGAEADGAYASADSHSNSNSSAPQSPKDAITTTSQSKQSKSVSITPPPGQLAGKSKSKKKIDVTPSPVPPSGTGTGDSSVSTKTNTNTTGKPSKSALKQHEKWQEECRKSGGTGRIVVNKPEAKKLIFDLCNDSFQPMNITQIHQVSETTDDLTSIVYCIALHCIALHCIVLHCIALCISLNLTTLTYNNYNPCGICRH